MGGLAADLVVGDAEAHHVHAHVRRGLVGNGAGQALKQGLQKREGLDVAVVVHRGFAVCGEVEVVDDVGVVEVHRGCLVGQVHRVVERQVPDGEGLKLGVARLHAAQILVVDLR